ncbi:hypothetical protein [Telmatospirillum sp. J64-1]|uniref:hypothetical protein n=1 Tax=Telmatospirillum sp. J64-1 TaxID=2502183 RepID=UPI00115C6566|nr:hypothetical protein [Telmatospirillum sp. J64-1]
MTTRDSQGQLFLVIAILTYFLILVLNRTLPPEIMERMVNENGEIELAQWLVITTAFFLASATYLTRLRRSEARPLLKTWFVLLALGSLYISGEEISWGQWFFFWDTPESLMALNDQGETNLHNMSSWFDQKPRALVEIGIIIGGIILPLWMRFSPRLAQHDLAMFVPSLALLPTAVLVEWSALPSRAGSWFGPDAPLSFLFLHRSSEVQELFIYMFILFYVLELRRRIPGHVAERAVKALHASPASGSRS